MRWSYYHNKDRTETQEKHLFQSHAATKHETQHLNQGILALELVPYYYFLTQNLFKKIYKMGIIIYTLLACLSG